MSTKDEVSRERKIFEACLQVPLPARGGFLDQTCSGDSQLRVRLERLLEAHEKAEKESTELNLSPLLEAEDPEQIGQYRIIERLGKGGMGVVYRAVDPRLNREVALKVIHPMAEGMDVRLIRLRREAQALASITHPNIAVIHDLEEADGLTAIVLELVEGPTLADRIGKGPLPLNQALTIALKVANALEAAHEKGIVHRDLKPSNVKLTPEGGIKVLDFGLAKPMEALVRASSTTTDSLTVDGAVVGTPTYMSPEQAKGKTVDQRADIWALGCVLYEMLTARSPFRAETPTETLVNVIGLEPDWKLLPKNVPPVVRHLLVRCLEKDPRQRLQAVGEFRIALQRYLDHPEEALFPALDEPRVSTPRQRFLWGIWIVAGLVAGVFLGWLFFRQVQPSANAVYLQLASPAAEPLFVNQGAAAVLSPDGRQIAYVYGRPTDGSQRRIDLRTLNESAPRTLAGTEGGYNPFFSPDGRWIGFVTALELKKVSVLGGQPLTLAAVSRSRGASWGPDGTIVISPERYGGLVRLSEDGGDFQPLTNLDEGEWGHRWPQFLPDGRRLLFTSLTSPDVSAGRIEVLDLDTGQRTVVQSGATFGRYSHSGHLLYWREGTVFAAPFEARTAAITGPSQPVIHGVAGNAEGGGQFDVSPQGTLVSLPGSAGIATQSHLTWIDRQGNVSRASTVTGNFTFGLKLSPDEKQLATSRNDRGNIDVWVSDLEQDIPTRLTFHEATDGTPVWGADGNSIFFASNREVVARIYQVAADGSGTPRKVLDSTYNQFPDSVSPDGRFLIFHENHPETDSDLWILPLDGRSTPERYLVTPFRELGARFSPDGKLVAYVSHESGRGEVYIRTFPISSGKWRVSVEGGAAPRWAGDGGSIFFRQGNQVLQSMLSFDGGNLQVQRPEVAITAAGGFGGGLYDVTADGTRILTVQTDPGSPSGETITTINVALNWFEALKRAF